MVKLEGEYWKAASPEGRARVFKNWSEIKGGLRAN